MTFNIIGIGLVTGAMFNLVMVIVREVDFWRELDFEGHHKAWHVLVHLGQNYNYPSEFQKQKRLRG